MKPIERIMRLAPVVPVLVIDEPKYAAPIAEALVRGGLFALEVTLRTGAALEVIREMKSVPGAVVGAGTVLNPRQLKDVIDAGVEFVVSPGLTRNLGEAAIESGIPYLPGIATASEIMIGLELDLGHFKFFPAATSGGVAGLKALAGPFGKVCFCPTGGVRQDTARDWLSIDQVLCVGGSWIVPAGPPDLPAIEAAARLAASL